MDTNTKRMLHGLMTEQEIAETSDKWSKVGTEGSRERDCAFDLLRLSYHIEQAGIPNQLPTYEAANCEQFLFVLRAVRETYKLTNKKIEDGLNWLKTLGLLPGDWYIPSIDDLVARSKIALNKRTNKGNTTE